MYGMGVVSVLDKQNVRLYCLNLTHVIGDRCSMRSQSHFHALFKYIMYNNNGSLLIVECMERVSCWRWMISAYVCIAACVLELGGVVGDRNNMHEVAISPSHTLQ